MMIYRWVQLQGDAMSGVPHPVPPPAKAGMESMTPRKLVWFLLLEPERLHPREQQKLSALREESMFNLAYTLTQQFVAMVKDRNAQPLDTWLLACQTSGISELDTFAQGLQKERSALQTALTLPYSNGPVEGNVNKLKYIKRSMYGRGGFPLLKQRVLKAT